MSGITVKEVYYSSDKRVHTSKDAAVQAELILSGDVVDRYMDHIVESGQTITPRGAQRLRTTIMAWEAWRLGQ